MLVWRKVMRGWIINIFTAVILVFGICGCAETSQDSVVVEMKSVEAEDKGEPDKPVVGEEQEQGEEKADPLSNAEQQDMFTYIISDNGAVVTGLQEGYEGLGQESMSTDREIKIPDTLGGYSVVEIGDHAFWVISPIPTRTDDPYYRRLWRVTCRTITPPLIIGDPFAYPRAIELYVPDISFDVYYNTVGWKEFKTINDVETPSSLKLILSPTTLKISLTDGYLNLTSEKELSRVMIYNLNGLEIADCILNGNHYSEEVLDQTPELFILKVIYADGIEEVFKLCK